MKKHIVFLLLTIMILSIMISSCYYFTDPLFPIKRIARSNSIDKKAEAGLMYDKVIQILTDAYRFNGSLNKDVGRRLMYNGNYTNAIKHLEIAKSIRNTDPDIYYWLAISYVNLYRINKDLLKVQSKEEEIKQINEYLNEAEKNYLIALSLSPGYKDVYYSYAHLLVYAKEDLITAKEILNKYLFEINQKETPDIKALFLLAHVHYALGEYKNAYRIFEKIYQYKKSLTKDELNKLEEYITEIREKLGE